MKKKLTAIIITLTMMLSCLVPAYAQDIDAPGTEMVSNADTDMESTDISDVDELPADIADSVIESVEEDDSEAEAALPEESEVPGTESDESPVPDDELMTDEPYDLSDEIIKGASTANHANVEVRKNVWGANQKFTLLKLGNGNYVFYNFKSSKAIGAASHTPVSGHNVHQYEYVGTTNQQWIAVTNSDGTYSFLNAANKKLALALNSGTAKEHVNVQVTTRSNSKAQRFRLAEASFAHFTGNISLRPSSKTSLAETVASNSKTSGAKVQLGSANGSAAQVFTYQRVWGGYYLLVNKNSGMVLGTAGQAKKAGTYVNQYAKKSWQYQLWKPVNNGDGTVTFYSRLNSDMVLDAGGTGSGTRLQW